MPRRAVPRGALKKINFTVNIAVAILEAAPRHAAPRREMKAGVSLYFTANARRGAAFGGAAP